MIVIERMLFAIPYSDGIVTKLLYGEVEEQQV
jgi:hypothetical protein